jgi:TPR repeat protein
LPREILSGKMFEEERGNEVINKEIAKKYIKEFGKELMKDEISIISSMTPGIIHNTTITHKIPNYHLSKTTEEMIKLITMLPQGGSFKNKYMPPEVKKQISKIVDLILENKSVHGEYEKYLSSIDKISMTYSPSEAKQKRAVSRNNAINDLRKNLSNIVLKNTKNLLITHKNFTKFAEVILEEHIKNLVNDDQLEFTDKVQVDDSAFTLIDNNSSLDLDNLGIDQLEDIESFPPSLLSDEEAGSNDNTYSFDDTGSVYSGEEKYYIKWDKIYKSALNELYNTHDYEKAIELLNSSASKGNVLAIHDLGKVCQRGLGCIANEKLAELYYSKAFQGFNILYKVDEKPSMKEYLAYRIGKMFNTGHGTDENIEMAEKWFKTADNNKYAQYSLAKIYMDKDIANGQPSHSYEIINLLKSASEKSAYASYELGNIYRKSYFTDIDSKKSYHHYNAAINKFNEMLKLSSDDTLMYRVGKMYELGLGTEIDLPKATKLFQEAGKLKNRYALYSLAKIYLASDDPKLHEKSIQILNDLYKKRPDDDMVLYSLGKIYLDTKTDFHDINKAKEFLEKSSKVGNQFARERKISCVRRVNICLELN